MKVCGLVEVLLRPFLTSGWSVTLPYRFTPGEGPGCSLSERLVGPRAGLDTWDKM